MTAADPNNEPSADLFRALDEAWRLTTAGHGLDEVDPHCRAAVEACARLSEAPTNPDLEAELAVAVEKLETDAREIFRDELADPENRGQELAILRLRSRLLRRAIRRLVGRESVDELPFLLSELQDLEKALVVRQESDAQDEIEIATNAGDNILDVVPGTRLEEIDAIRIRLLSRHAEELLESRPEGPLTSAKELAQGFRYARELGSLENRLARHAESLEGEERSTTQTEFAEIAARVNVERLKLEDLAFERAAKLEDVESIVAALDVASRLVDELDEAQLGAAERGGSREVNELRALAQSGQRMLGIVQGARKTLLTFGPEVFGDLCEELEKRARRTERRLKRLSRRLTDLANDRVLRRRLERLFGARPVRYWETLVFWLIVGVLGLIFVDHYREPDPEGVIGWTIWADTAICLVLLYDLAVRVFLSPSRRRYFFRHFVTDFLPALPFAFIFVVLPRLLSFDGLRALRFLRLLRVAPRLVQSLGRIFRLLLFVARALDRLVERNAWILNWNIVFFTDAVKDEDEHVLTKRMRDLDSWVRRGSAALFADLPPKGQDAGARWRVAAIEASLPLAEGLKMDAHTHQKWLSGVREKDVDDVIRHLRNLDERRVASLLGLEFASSLTSSLRFFRIPFLRRIPVVRFVLGPSGVPDPLVATARLSHVLGDLLAFAQRTINWFADLYGTITGAQFLDRLGLQMIKATAQPTKRVLVFALLLAGVWLFGKIVNIGQMDGVIDGFVKAIDQFVIVIAAICLVPLLLGFWFRRIARQATDFYERVAEAQFLALTELDKEVHAGSDLRFLAERVLIPEGRLDGTLETEDSKSLLERIESSPDSLTETLMAQNGDVETETRIDQVRLLYRDYADGAWFHRNDTKVANLLIGNLTLENIRRHRFAESRATQKRLDRLDMGRRKGGLRGPYVWFNFITHSVAQETARLIIEYNQHVIPVEEMSSADPIDLEIYEHWRQRRHRLSESRRRGEDGVADLGADPSSKTPASSGGTLTYRTTEFNALHFLTIDEARDDRIRRRYGDDVAELLREDRENLIRTIFGTFPMHTLPPDRRTLNPYAFYRRYGARGRFFLAPLWISLFGMKLARILVGRLIHIIRDLITPDQRARKTNICRAGFEVARRKIHRMRRPVVMEAMRLRAEFDFEYLGIPLPGEREPGVAEDSIVSDLSRINASEREWEEFRVLKSKRQHRIRLLSAFLARHCGEMTVKEWMSEQRPNLAGRQGPGLRAAAIAFALDRNGVASLLDGLDRLQDLMARCQGGTIRRRPLGRIKKAWSTMAIHRKLGRCWSFIAGERWGDDALRQSFKSALIYGGEKNVQDLARLDQSLVGDKSPDDIILEQFFEVAESASSWSEQVVAVRTVQSLGMLDLLGYEDLIRRLGGFEDEAEGEEGESQSEEEPSPL